MLFPWRADSEKRLSEHITELKKQVKGRDDIIQRLERDLKAKEGLYKEVEERLAQQEQTVSSVQGSEVIIFYNK